ncbi:2'-5' RNA ligase family protein [Treponema socranskii]|uniref:2'-5' RNA ligase family protein n=1 Tax=Treponema socranskii TaxID=53419 RepID=UPI003D947BC7
MIRQTHFIGVLVPENLLVPLEACRAWMRARFGCKSGQGTPLHITLVPPFYLDENFSERNLLKTLAEAASAWGAKRQTLCCAVNGFGAFSSRTIFAHVEPSSEWTALRTLVYDSLLAKCPGTAKRDMRTFVPHITLANRDIPPGAIEDALSYFDSLDLHESFDVRSITLFAMRGGTWTERETFAMTELY